VTIAALCLAAALQAAGSTPAQPMRTIEKGADSAVESARQAIARTPEEWARLWHQHSWDRPTPTVDFAHEMVAGVFMGTRPTAGFSIEIVGARQEQGTLVVEYRETRPGRDTITAQVITAPYHLVAIPQFTGTVTFRKIE
jgi:hypothetical protein